MPGPLEFEFEESLSAHIRCFDAAEAPFASLYGVVTIIEVYHHP